jgi:hypothetical protein
MWKSFIIIFKRSPNDENVLAKSSTTHRGKVVLRTMGIRMPNAGYDINYANQLKLKLLKTPEESISLHAYQCIQKSVSGKNLTSILQPNLPRANLTRPILLWCFSKRTQMVTKNEIPVSSTTAV